MKIFMSWSGRRSHAAAEVLSWWLKCVIQASRPWISSEDVDRGALWFSEITNVLADTSVGIVCLTEENKDRPWILFEAGALAKGLSNSRVCTFLVDLEPKDIKDPLAQFNHTGPTKDDMKKLARTLNSVLGVNALDTNVLSDVCDTYWPLFEIRFLAAMEANKPAGPVVARADDDVLGEILESVRGMTQRIRYLEGTREQIPMWSSDDVSDSARANMDALTAEIRNAHLHGVSTEAISEYAKRFGVPRSTLMTIIGDLDAEAFNSATASNVDRNKESLRRAVRKAAGISGK